MFHDDYTSAQMWYIVIYFITPAIYSEQRITTLSEKYNISFCI